MKGEQTETAVTTTTRGVEGSATDCDFERSVTDKIAFLCGQKVS